MADDNNSSNFLIGFIAGSAIGAAVALLFTPKTGKQLRDDMLSRTGDYLDEADQYIADARVKAKDLINEGKKKSEKLIHEARTKSEELLKDAEKIFDDAKAKTGDYSKDNLDRLKGAVKAGVDAYKDIKKS